MNAQNSAPSEIWIKEPDTTFHNSILKKDYSSKVPGARLFTNIQEKENGIILLSRVWQEVGKTYLEDRVAFVPWHNLSLIMYKDISKLSREDQMLLDDEVETSNQE